MKKNIINKIGKYRILQYKGDFYDMRYYTVEKRGLFGWKQISKFYNDINECFELIEQLGGLK